MQVDKVPSPVQGADDSQALWGGRAGRLEIERPARIGQRPLLPRLRDPRHPRLPTLS